MAGESTRRSFLTHAGAAAAAVAGMASSARFGMARDYGPDAEPVRYPDPDMVVLDERFNKYKLGNTPIQRLYHSKEMLWAEGTAWCGVGIFPPMDEMCTIRPKPCQRMCGRTAIVG